MPIRKISTRPPGSDRSSQLPTTKCESEAARMSGGHTTSVRGTAPPSPPVLLSRPSRVTAPGTEGSPCPYTSGDPSPLLAPPLSSDLCRRFSVPTCQNAPSPCCCPPCVRVQHGCPARCGTAVATMLFDTANAYYDIAFAVPGVKT